MLHGNDGHLRHLFFDIINSDMQFLLTNLSRIFRSLLDVVSGHPEPLFSEG
jgi:hypothetical protein